MEAVAVATEQGTPETPFPITSVANAGKWFHWEQHSSYWYKWTFGLETTSKLCRREEQESALLDFIRVLYDKKIGEITSRWNDEIHLSEWVDQERISFEHAQVKLGDVFDYYTINGELTFPQWARFKYNVCGRRLPEKSYTSEVASETHSSRKEGWSAWRRCKNYYGLVARS